MYSTLYCKTLETSIQDAKVIEAANRGLKLYKIDLLQYQYLVPDLTSILSTSERLRANRYHFVKDKNRFIICRAFLKILLADRLDVNVARIDIAIDSNKKPYLINQPSVFFNVSHSADYALIAIAKSPVGVDIEYVNKSFDYKEILPNIFNKIETDDVQHSHEKHFIFYKFWTRKEAIVKAIGKGIDDDLIRIPVTDGLHSVPLSLVGDFKNLSVYSFKIDDDYIGALSCAEENFDLDHIVFYPLPTSEELKSLI